MGLKISIAVTGGEELTRALQVKIDQIKDLRPAWNQLDKQLASYQRKVFMSKGAHGGLSEWRPLKPGTSAAKSRQGFARWANFPLIRTQALFKAWTSSTAEGAVRVKEKLFYAYGIDEGEIHYAKYHQYGAFLWNGGLLPKREHLRLTDAARKLIGRTILRYLASSKQLVQKTVFGNG